MELSRHGQQQMLGARGAPPYSARCCSPWGRLRVGPRTATSGSELHDSALMATPTSPPTDRDLRSLTLHTIKILCMSLKPHRSINIQQRTESNACLVSLPNESIYRKRMLPKRGRSFLFPLFALGNSIIPRCTSSHSADSVREHGPPLEALNRCSICSKSSVLTCFDLM